VPAISFSNGLASGLNTQAIIDAIVSAARRPAVLIEGQIADRTNQVSAFQSLSAMLLSLKIETDKLGKTDNFDALSVTSSDEDVLTATAESSASPGSYTFTVDALAQHEILGSQGFASADAVVGTGTVSIAVGSGDAATITVGAAASTLSGLRDAINASDAGVTASIINTGSGSAPYKLILTAKETGAANTIDIETSLTGGTAPAFARSISSVAKGAGFAGTATFTNVGPATNGAYSGTSVVASAGSYTGAASRTFTFDASSGGTIGTDAITFTYNDGAGGTGSIVVPAGYAAGTEIAVRDGLAVTFAAGTVVAGDDFTVATTGRGNFTGTKSKTYSFSVTTGGAVGTDAITIGWNDGEGATGTINVPAAYAARSQIAVAEGVVLALDGGTLATGDTFSISTASPVLQAAQDASMTFGSGSGSGNTLTLTSATNEFANVIDGLTITANSVSDTPVTLEVERDVEAIKEGVTNFVSRYNGVIDYLKKQLTYDAETKSSGVLFGDSTLLTLDLSLRRLATSQIAGLGSAFKALSSVGIQTDSSGRLSVNETKLADALDDDLDGVRGLFAAVGETTDEDVTLLSVGSSARATATHRDSGIVANGYAVEITRAADHARMSGAPIADPAVTPFVVGSANNVMQIKVNGSLSAQINVTEGSYATGDALASELQAKLNADPGLATSRVTVAYVSDGGGTGHFEFSSEAYGDTASIELVATAGNIFTGGLGFTESQMGVAARGIDVAGTINGEEAHGIGQLLVGGPLSPDDPDEFETLGVQLVVSLSPEQLAAQGSDQGAVRITEGVGARLSRELDRLTDATSGTIASREDGLNRQVDALNEQIDRIEARLLVRRRTLEEQFARLERAMLDLQSQSAFLGSQLANLNTQTQGSR